MRRLIGARILDVDHNSPNGLVLVAEYRLDPRTGAAVCVAGRETTLNADADRFGVPIHGGFAPDRDIASLVKSEFGGSPKPAYYKPRDGRRFLLALVIDYSGGSRTTVEPLFEVDESEGRSS